VSILAFSQGAITALACAYHISSNSSKASNTPNTPNSWKNIENIILFNPATIFFPPWLAKMYREVEGKSFTKEDERRFYFPRITSYVIEWDPLSDGVNGQYTCPRVRGETVILPARAAGFDNHKLVHFLQDPRAAK